MMVWYVHTGNVSPCKVKKSQQTLHRLELQSRMVLTSSKSKQASKHCNLMRHLDHSSAEYLQYSGHRHTLCD